MNSTLKYWIFIAAVLLSQFLFRGFDIQEAVYYTFWVVGFICPIMLFTELDPGESSKKGHVALINKLSIALLIFLYISSFVYFFIYAYQAFLFLSVWALAAGLLFLIIMFFRKKIE